MTPRPETVIPPFTQTHTGEGIENKVDESDILTDQDLTTADRDVVPLEDEPGDFVRGEVDVKEQMDRAAEALDASIRGIRPPSDREAAQETPGGLEEVAAKTDQDLATRSHRH